MHCIGSATFELHLLVRPAIGDEEGAADLLIVAEAPSAALGAKCDQTMLNAAFDAVLLDCKAADAGEIDCLVIGVAAPTERIEVLGASPPLEDIDRASGPPDPPRPRSRDSPVLGGQGGQHQHLP